MYAPWSPADSASRAIRRPTHLPHTRDASPFHGPSSPSRSPALPHQLAIIVSTWLLIAPLSPLSVAHRTFTHNFLQQRCHMARLCGNSTVLSVGSLSMHGAGTPICALSGRSPTPHSVVKLSRTSSLPSHSPPPRRRAFASLNISCQAVPARRSPAPDPVSDLNQRARQQAIFPFHAARSGSNADPSRPPRSISTQPPPPLYASTTHDIVPQDICRPSMSRSACPPLPHSRRVPRPRPLTTCTAIRR